MAQYGEAVGERIEIFSWRLSRLMRSSTRLLTGSDGSQYGSDVAFASTHPANAPEVSGFGGGGGGVGGPLHTPPQDAREITMASMPPHDWVLFPAHASVQDVDFGAEVASNVFPQKHSVQPSGRDAAAGSRLMGSIIRYSCRERCYACQAGGKSDNATLVRPEAKKKE